MRWVPGFAHKIRYDIDPLAKSPTLVLYATEMPLPVLTVRRAALTPWPAHAGAALRTEDLEMVKIESDSTSSSGVWTEIESVLSLNESKPNQLNRNRIWGKAGWRNPLSTRRRTRLYKLPPYDCFWLQELSHRLCPSPPPYNYSTSWAPLTRCRARGSHAAAVGARDEAKGPVEQACAIAGVRSRGLTVVRHFPSSPTTEN
jgi:hypothetical protein